MDPSPPHDWITSVTRPLQHNPELELAARRELTQRAAHAPPPQLATIQERFDQIDQTSPKKRTLFYWLPIVLAFAITTIGGTTSYLRFQKIRNFIPAMNIGPMGAGHSYSPLDELQSGMSAADRLFVFGDPTQPTAELRAKSLWQSQPDNAPLFAAYIANCDPLPPNFLESANKLDPDNGWFDLIAAGELGDTAVAKQKKPRSGPNAPPPFFYEWDITDEVAFQEALDLLTTAAAKPRITYYGGSLMKERLAMLPSQPTCASRIGRLTYAASYSIGDIFEILGASEILAAKAFLLGQKRDAQGLQALIPTAEVICQRLSDQEGTLVFQLVIQATCTSVYAHLLQASELCGLDAEASRLRPIALSLQEERELRRNSDQSEGDLLKKHGELLTALASPGVSSLGVPPPTIDEMKAGRMANYTLLERTTLWIAAALLLLSALLVQIPARIRGPLAANLAPRLASILSPRDWAFIFFTGTIAPIVWLLLISRLTPLGCRDWGLGYFLGQPAATQYAGTLFLIIAATLSATRWRLGKQLGALGFPQKQRFSGFLPVLGISLAIPLSGFIRFGSSSAPLITALIIASAFSLWLLFCAARSVFGRPQHAVRRATVATVLAPAFAGATLLLLVFIPFTHLAERHWIAKDTLLTTAPIDYGMGKLEREGAAAVKSRLRAALNPAP